MLTKCIIIKLIKIQNGEGDFQYFHNLIVKHIFPDATKRPKKTNEKVRKPAELFSRTIGKLISYNFLEFSHVGKVLEMVNNGSEILQFHFLKLEF